MKTISKITLVFVLSIFSLSTVLAQSYNHPIKSAKRLVIKSLIGEIEFVSISGSEIQIEAKGFEANEKRADGLREVYGGAKDNTGIGIGIIESDNSIYLAGASKKAEDAKYVIKVPNTISLEVDYSSPFADADELKFDGFSNEITVTTMDANLIFTNVTGPITASTIDGDVTAIFTTVSQDNPISLSSIDGVVDVTLPANTKANLSLSTFDGSVYTDMDIEYTNKTKKHADDDEFHFIGGRHGQSSTLNGGGVEINLSTIDGSIYLRKK